MNIMNLNRDREPPFRTKLWRRSQSCVQFILAALMLHSCASVPENNQALPATPEMDAGHSSSNEKLEVLEDLIERTEIDEWLDTQKVRFRAVGLGVAVVEGSKIRYLKGFGYSNRETQTLSDPKKTLWRLASLSKGITGVIATRLALFERVDLNAPIPDLSPEFSTPKTYLPEDCDSTNCVLTITATTPELSLDHLLHQVGGIPHYSNGLGDPAPPQNLANQASENTGIRWALEYLNEKPLVAQPGERYAYTTFGYNLAGAVLEALTNKSFDTLLEEELKNPGGLSSIQVDRLWQTHPDAAIGYHKSGEDIESDERWDVSWKAPGGGLIASVEDMARYCSGLLQSHFTLHYRDQHLWQARPDEKYAHGFNIKSDNGRIIEHSGSQQGARTGLHIIEDADLCVVVMSNTTTFSAINLARSLADRWQE